MVKNMNQLSNPERRDARNFDAPMRQSEYTAIVYGGGQPDAPRRMNELVERCYPEKSPYNIYFGEMHGHTDLSDAKPDIDSYFTTARDTAKLDFCAISDHDHGGVHSTELWDERKWKLTRDAVRRYYDPGKFTTILAYERDSYPWYNNLVIYFNSHDAVIPRPSIPGEITKDELLWFLKQENLLVVPHTTSFLESGCDFTKIPPECMTPLIEIYSRWGTDEYFGNPNPVRIACRGGYFHDALARGAHMGVICGSDDHEGTPGIIRNQATHINPEYRWPGLTAVLCRENTLEDIFDALKKRRCYGFMGGRIYIDFRVNEHFMGEEFTLPENAEREIYFDVKADAPIKRISVVRGCVDILHFDGLPTTPDKYRYMFIDYSGESDTDSYYLRVELADGRIAWTSPVFLSRGEG